jgi:hypothetical protein
MIVTAVKCEMCPSQFMVHTYQQQYEWDVPAGWLIVIEGNSQYREGSHFCSPQCLSEWLVEKKSLVLSEGEVSAHD